MTRSRVLSRKGIHGALVRCIGIGGGAQWPVEIELHIAKSVGVLSLFVRHPQAVPALVVYKSQPYQALRLYSAPRQLRNLLCRVISDSTWFGVLVVLGNAVSYRRSGRTVACIS